MNIYQSIIEARKQNISCVLCTLIKTEGSSPQKPGAKMLVFKNGKIIGTIGGGTTELETINIAQKLLKENKEDFIFQTSEGKEVFIEIILPLPKLYIFGGGHVAMSLAKFVKWFDFQTTMIDPRENCFANNNLEFINIKISDYLDIIPNLPFDNNTYVVITTTSHEYDRDILVNVASKPHAYIGLIGSIQKVENIKNYCINNKLLTQEQLDNIDMPIGIKIATKTTDEIAISILAKLIDVKNTKTIF